MLKIKKLDHVAVCVADIDEAAAQLARGASASSRASARWSSRRRPRRRSCPWARRASSSSRRSGNEGLERFLEKRGPGLHHIAVEVEGIETAIALLEGLGVPDD